MKLHKNPLVLKNNKYYGQMQTGKWATCVQSVRFARCIGLMTAGTDLNSTWLCSVLHFYSNVVCCDAIVELLFCACKVVRDWGGARRVDPPDSMLQGGRERENRQENATDAFYKLFMCFKSKGNKPII